MDRAPLQSAAATPSHRQLYLLVEQVAERLSYIRRVGRLFHEHKRQLDRVREIPSTEADMVKDWKDACAFVGLKVVDGEIEFTDIDPVSFPLLEEIWLTRVKRFKAYYIWEKGGTGTAEGDYAKAAHEIRERLLNSPTKPLKDFERVERYVRAKYLSDNGTLDDTKPALKMMIAGKARRIHETRGDTDCDTNWFRAKLYARMFYENLLPAVRDKSATATLGILKAFQFSKSPRNRYLVINAFEAATSISFLDKDAIRCILDDPQAYDFSLEPVRDWPARFAIPPVCAGRFRYDKEDKQLVYEGVMSEVQRDALAATATLPERRTAIESLFQQTHLVPYREMIL